MYAPDDLKIAARIFFALVADGELLEKDILFNHIRRQDILDCLYILADEAEMSLLPTSSAVYLVPRNPFTLFSCTNEDIKTLFRVHNDNDEKSNKFLYTCYMLIMVLLSEFYSSNNYTVVSRDFVSFKEWYRLVNDLVQNLLSMPDIQEISDSLEIRFFEAATFWESLNSFDTRASRRIGTARSDHMSYLRKVLGVMEEAKFIKIEHMGQSELSDSSIIYVTPKLTGFMSAYYSNDERRNQILDFVNERKRTNA